MTASNLIAVDIGNSSTKVGWFGNLVAGPSLPTPTATRSFATGESPSASLVEDFGVNRCHWRIASVHRKGTSILTDWIKSNRPHDDVQLLTYRDLPIHIRLDAPDRVGLDRLAAAVAANALRPSGQPALVIDAGSAITVDLVNSDGAFAGGAILPGFRMSAEALYGADLLPLAVLAPNDEPPSVIGTSTEDAIKSGLFWGAVGAVREIIERTIRQLDQPPAVFVTGGDLRQLAEHLCPDARFIPNLVLSGIALSAAHAK